MIRSNKENRMTSQDVQTLDRDSADVCNDDSGAERIGFDVPSRRRYNADARHRRRGNKAQSKNGAHRRRNKRNGL